MSLTELVKAIERQAISQRKHESELLHDIAAITNIETAEAAADIFAAEKHAYSFDGYLYQLTRLKEALLAGIPTEEAIEAVDSCIGIDVIIEMYREGKRNEQMYILREIDKGSGN